MYQYKMDGNTHNADNLRDMITHLRQRVRDWTEYLTKTETRWYTLAQWAEKTDAAEAWELFESVDKPYRAAEEMLECAKLALRGLEDAWNEVEYIEKRGEWGA